MSEDISDLAEVVETGWPTTQLVACKKCGVLLWDAPGHYAHAHSFPCVVDGCAQRFYRYSDLNAHSREHHVESNPFSPGGYRYPGANDLGDFTWLHLASDIAPGGGGAGGHPGGAGGTTRLDRRPTPMTTDETCKHSRGIEPRR